MAPPISRLSYSQLISFALEDRQIDVNRSILTAIVVMNGPYGL